MFDNLSAGKKILSLFAAVFLLALISWGANYLLLSRVSENGVSVGERLSPLGDAAMEIKLTAANAHLLMEEIMAGDTAESIEEVEALLDESAFYASAILNGGENDEGRFYPSSSPEVRKTIERVLIEIEEFRVAARARHAMLDDAQGVGSEADAEFDALYDGLTDSIAALAARFPDQPVQQRLLGEARFNLAHGHLLVAEILGGDEGEDFTEATDSFAAAGAALERAASFAPAGQEEFERIAAGAAQLTVLAQVRRERMAERSAMLETAEVDFDASFDTFVRDADAAEEMIHDAMAAGLARLRRDASFAIGIMLGAGAVLAGALALAYRSLNRSFGTRLKDLSGTINPLLEGNLDVDLPTWTSSDEVGVLREAIARMKDAFRRQVQLEHSAKEEKAEAERQKQEAERQRAGAEADRAAALEAREAAAARATAANAFAAEVKAVVAKAVAGEIDHRIEARFSDEDFNGLADDINRLLHEVARGIGETSQVLSAVAKGNLSQRVTGEFAGIFAQLQHDVNATADKMKEVVIAISRSTESIVEGSTMIAKSSEGLASRAASQAASVEEITAAMTEMSGRVQKTSGNADYVASQAQAVEDKTLSANEVLSTTIDAIGEISASSQQVKQIISVIDDISFQTNLLALNAGVEAARAGDAGKGFAVVAQEVRQLAQRASEAARDIGNLIEDSARDVEKGVTFVNQTGSVLKEVVTAIGGLSAATTEITTAMQEQRIDVDAVTSSILDVDRITQANALVAETGATEASGLFAQTQELRKLLSFFAIESDRGGEGEPDGARKAA